MSTLPWAAINDASRTNLPTCPCMHCIYNVVDIGLYILKERTFRHDREPTQAGRTPIWITGKQHNYIDAQHKSIVCCIYSITFKDFFTLWRDYFTQFPRVSPNIPVSLYTYKSICNTIDRVNQIYRTFNLAVDKATEANRVYRAACPVVLIVFMLGFFLHLILPTGHVEAHGGISAFGDS